MTTGVGMAAPHLHAAYGQDAAIHRDYTQTLLKSVSFKLSKSYFLQRMQKVWLYGIIR